MEDKKALMIHKDNIFTKIKNFFTNLFKKKSKKEINIKDTLNQNHTENIENKFNEYIIFKENKEDLNIINKVRNNKEILQSMSLEELEKIETAIKNRQMFIDRKIQKLQEDLIMKKNLI